MPLDVSNYYLFRASNGASVMCRRGDGVPRIASGGPRYELVERPKRKSVVQWVGDDPYVMDVPVILDGWRTGTSVENDIAKLNQMFQSNGPLLPPDTVRIDGAVPVKGAKWVIQGIDWGDVVIWAVSATSNKGYRLRQDAVVHLLQYVEEAVLQRNAPGRGNTPYVVKAGETAQSIAAAFSITVAELKSANNIRDAKTIKTGDRLRIPASKVRN